MKKTRVAHENAFERAPGIVEATKLQSCGCDIVECPGIAWVDRQGCLEMLESFGVLAFLAQHLTDRAVHERGVIIDGEACAIGGDGLIAQTLVPQFGGDVAQNPLSLGSNFGGGLEMGEGLAVIAAHAGDLSEAAVRVEKARIERQRLSQISLCLVEFAELLKRGGDIAQSPDVVWIDRRRATKMHERFFMSALVAQNLTERAVRFKGVGISRQNSSVGGDSVGAATVTPRQRRPLIGDGLVLGRLRGVGDSPNCRTARTSAAFETISD